MKKHSLNKQERLKSKKAISDLFSSSYSYGKGSIRLLWKVKKEIDIKYYCKIVIAVPKRRIKKAVDRNRIKRLIKEAYRRNKSDICAFYKDNLHVCHIVVLYTGNMNATFDSINNNLRELLDKMPMEYEKHFK